MKEIYWITRLDKLEGLFVAGLSVFIIIAIILIVVCLGRAFIDEDTDAAKKIGKWIPVTIFLLFFNIMGLVFVPTTKEALTILGVGGTIEYVKDNETLRELPDKCVKALDMWVDSLIKE